MTSNSANSVDFIGRVALWWRNLNLKYIIVTYAFDNRIAGCSGHKVRIWGKAPHD